MKKYNIEVSEAQAKLISLALDMYSRMEGGQLQWVFSMISWKYYENLKNAEPLLNELQQLLTGMQRGNLGIGNVSNTARMAYDLHQIIRYRLSLDEKQHNDSLNNTHKYTPAMVGVSGQSKRRRVICAVNIG